MHRSRTKIDIFWNHVDLWEYCAQTRIPQVHILIHQDGLDASNQTTTVAEDEPANGWAWPGAGSKRVEFFWPRSTI